MKGTIHWVSAQHGVPAEVRLYDHLYTAEYPGQATGDFLDDLNPDSLEVVQAVVEPSLKDASVGQRYQFERTGYFCVDDDTTADKPVFNRTVTLRDTWAKIQKKQ